MMWRLPCCLRVISGFLISQPESFGYCDPCIHVSTTTRPMQEWKDHFITGAISENGGREEDIIVAVVW